MKKIVCRIASLVVFVIFLGCPTNPSENDEPVQIATAAQLDAVRNNLGGRYILTADIDLSGYENWNPIGIFQPASDKPEDAETPDFGKVFSGVFDGNGHTISNLTINRPSDFAVGLFGCVSGTNNNPAAISNLKIENAHVTGFFLVGSVAGLMNGTLENITLAGNNTIQGVQGVGGIVGNSGGDVKNCIATANIIVSTAYGYEAACAGIVAGGNEGGSFINCRATGGSIVATGDNCWGLGGVSGAPYSSVAITNCRTENITISASGSNNHNIGGLVGFTGTYADSDPTLVSNCTVTGISINVSDTTTSVGGVVGGSMAGSQTGGIPSIFTIRNCSSSGSISGGGTSVGSITGYSYHSTVENDCASTMTWNGGTPNKVGASE
jgi:hypothetical protein